MFYYVAIDGEDYKEIYKEIIFDFESDPYALVYIPLFNDECVENDEDFHVELFSSLDCVNVVNGSVHIAIEDDDCKFE